MRPGGEDLLRQFNKGMDYAQNTFNIAEGVTSFAPTLIFKGVVIDVDFEVSKSTTTAALLPPFSVFAKIIGMDESSADPLEETDKVYYPPFFPMHSICIPEVGEEVLILKETPEPSAAGYYVGRVNDSTPLNISYARDYVALNDPETRNSYRYGFNFDVRKLREKFSFQSPSPETANISIPLTFGDVVQQGRSKTYVRQSFNKNNKKGVLEQGIRVEGQVAPGGVSNEFRYFGSDDGMSINPLPQYQNDNLKYAPQSYLSQDGETDEIDEYIDPDLKSGFNSDGVLKVNQDPSIGETSTKTIHFIDSSIRRLGNYSYQSLDVGEQNNNLEGEDKAMIVNIADEIYNISSRDISGALYRQVLGEKMVSQQRQTYDMMNKILQTVSGFAETTQVLLDAFVDHEHAIPKIELNLEKTIKTRDRYRTRPKYEPQPNLIVQTPAQRIRVRVGTNRQTGRAIYSTTTVPGSKQSIPQPPKLIKKSQTKWRSKKHKINFEAIIGGEEDPRFTAPIETDRNSSNLSALPGSAPVNIEKTEIGKKTEKVDSDLENIKNNFQQQQQTLQKLSTEVSKILSKNQFIS